MQQPFHTGFPYTVVNHLTSEAVGIARFLGVNTKFPPDDCGGVKGGLVMVQAWDFAFQNLGLILEKNSSMDFYPDSAGKPFHQSLVDVIDFVKIEAEARFISAVIAWCVVPEDKERVLQVWDVMLERLGLSVGTIDFDISEHLGIARQAKAA